MANSIGSVIVYRMAYTKRVPKSVKCVTIGLSKIRL